MVHSAIELQIDQSGIKTKKVRRKTKAKFCFFETFKISDHMGKLSTDRDNFSCRVEQTKHVYGSLRIGRGLLILRSEKQQMYDLDRRVSIFFRECALICNASDERASIFS